MWDYYLSIHLSMIIILVTVHAFYRSLSFALSGLKMLARFVTQGVALGWSILPFQG